MIKVTDLIYEYPDKRALHNLSLDIGKGEICALVGPNGAGKTTLLRCLAALELPFSGTVNIDGTVTHEDPRLIHRKVGYLSDFFGLYDELTVAQCLTYIAWCHKVEPSEVASTVDWAIGKLGLTKYQNAKAGTLSRGLRQRLAIAQSILHKPRVLLLDEPASGLDPDARSQLSGFLKSLQRSGMTIIVSSHILAELEDYCTSMLVIDGGKILDHVQLDEFQAQEKQTLFISLLEEDETHSETIMSQDSITSAQIIAQQDDKITFECAYTGDTKQLHTLLKALLKQKLPICGFHVQSKTLQHAYRDLSAKNKTKNKAQNEA